MRTRIMISSIWAAYLSLFLLSSLACAETKPAGFATPFPDLNFTQVLSKGEKVYLGLPQKKSFSFREIRGELILVEFTSTYCEACQRQAPIFNELFSSIEKDLKLKGKVKIIGVAAGNNLREAEIFKKHYGIPYPILSDPEFDVHAAVGSPRTPFTIWVRKDTQGRGVVVSTHLGLMNLQSLLEETKATLQYDLALLRPRKEPSTKAMP